MKTTRKESSYNQIVAAIKHFEAGELDCAITLAAAAEGMLHSQDDRFLFRKLRESSEATDIDFNLVINWLKHDTEPDLVDLSEFEAVITIARAITKFIAAYKQSCEHFEGFLQRSFEAGILPVKLHRIST